MGRKGQRKRISKVCAGCRQAFEVPPSQAARIVCSIKCRKLRCIVTGEDGVQRKMCKGCQHLVPVADFYKSSGLESLHSYCKPCDSARCVARAKTPQGKEWRKKSFRKPKERFRAGQLSALRRGYEWMITFEEHVALLQHPCHYCGQPLSPTGCGLDRKNDEPWYEMGNVVPCCWRCNSTFLDLYSYEEKLKIAAVIRQIDEDRKVKGIKWNNAPRSIRVSP